VSGPARPARPAQGARSRRVGADAGIALGLISGLEALAQHRLLERLIRGRTWIGIVAFALIGIVTLQLGLLKLNGGIGRALEHEAALQRQNAALSIENSELAAGSRVEARATQLGMAFVPVGSLRFLSSSSRGDIGKAAAALSTAARSSSAPSGETATPGGESGEAAGAEAQPTPEGETATASSSQATSEASAASGQSGESAAGEASTGESGASAESGAATSGESTSGESSAPSASAVTSAGGGVQAASGG
jgi:cell division protein FtsL